MHAQFVRFLAPLVLAMLAQELSVQFLNGGMARVPRATETLAAFGLAYGLISILSGPLYQSSQLGLAMIDNGVQLRTGRRVVAVAGLGLAALTAALGLGGPGRWLVEDLHGISPGLADAAQTALLLLFPLPLINGLTRYYSGLLARVRRTDVVSGSGLAGIVVRIGSVFALLGLPAVNAQPILLPAAVTLLGAATELAIVVWGQRRFGRRALPAAGEPVSVAAILRFLWPLAVIMVFQGASRPAINLVVSRGADATQALAVLTVAYALGHLHYGWLNELRSLPAAFREETDSLRHIRRFVVGCMFVALSLAGLLFWTPLRDVILLRWIGVEASLAALCVAPLRIFSLFPFVVALRGYYHGVGLVHRVTDAMALSGPFRLAAIAAALAALSFTDWAGATRGVAALFCGFAVEAVAVTWGVRRRVAAASPAQGERGS